MMSLQIAMQLQKEEEAKAERHRRREQELLMNIMHEPSHSQSMEEQLQIQRAIEESNLQNPNPDLMSYEEMLALGEKLGKVKKGLTSDQINTIPQSYYQSD